MDWWAQLNKQLRILYDKIFLTQIKTVKANYKRLPGYSKVLTRMSLLRKSSNRLF